MHRGHDHHHHDDGAAAPSTAPGLGHNGPAGRQPVQWQTVHRHGGALPQPPEHEADLDLVEAAFVEGFLHAKDPTSFLRLAHVRFEAVAADGVRLVLLRVEVESVADIGSVSPHFGSRTFRYDPLPAKLVSRRERLRFIYFDGENPRPMSLTEAMALGAAES
jgi:hypothetical protein